MRYLQVRVRLSRTLGRTFRCGAHGPGRTRCKERCYSTGRCEGLGSRPSVAFLNSIPLAQYSESAGDLCSTYGTEPALPLRPNSLTSPKQSLQRNSVSLSTSASATGFTFQNGS